MKITLKRVILCGAMFLSMFFFFLVLVVPVTASYGGLNGHWTQTATASWLGAGSKGTFHDAFGWNFAQQALMTIKSGSGEPLNPEKSATVADGTLKVMSIIGLILVLIDLAAIAGAFFLKTNKGARKLIIPFMAISIVMMFLVIAIPGALLCQSDSSNGIIFGDCQLGKLEILYFIGVAFFIGALIAAGVVKDKVLYEKKK